MADYKELKVLREGDGVCALITENPNNGRVTFSVFKEYEKDGVTRRTSFLQTRHIPSLRKLAGRVADEMELIEDRTREDLRR